MMEVNKKQAGSKIKTFQVPLATGKIKENIVLTTNSFSNLSKEQIISQAFKFHSEGNIFEAEMHYQYCIKQGFEDYRVFSNYGIILKSIGKLKEAELSFRKAIEIKPDYTEAHFNLGNILKALGKFQEAEKPLRKTIELKPDFAEAHLNLGIILTALGKFQEAEISTLKAIEIKPDYAEAHYNLGILGIILRDLDQLREAELSFRKAISIKPDYAEAHYDLGIILKALGNLQEAELATRKAIEIKPNFADAHSSLGSILESNNKLEEAKNSYRKIQVLKPDLDMNMSFASLYLKEKDPKNALILINKFLEINPADTTALAYKTIALRGVNKFDETNALINFPKLVKKIYSQNIIKEDIFEFNKKFRNSLLLDPRRRAEENQSGWAIRGGSVIRRLFTDLNNPFISQFHKMLSQAIENYIKDLPIDSEHPFLRKQIGQVSIDNCWVNFLKPGDFQANHIHNNGWLSGVYYLDEPKVEKNKSNAGWIEFNRSGNNLPHFGGEKEIKSIKPEVGMFILFPSYVWHGTIPYSADYTRGSISFDITIK